MKRFFIGLLIGLFITIVTILAFVEKENYMLAIKWLWYIPLISGVGFHLNRKGIYGYN